MMISMIRFGTFSLVCTLTVLMFFCGCEKDRDTDVPELEPYESLERGETYSVITVDPSSVSLSADGAQETFRIRGGTMPYTLEVRDISRGSITMQSQNSFVYQREASGDNIITIQDAAGNVAFLQITQE